MDASTPRSPQAQGVRRVRAPATVVLFALSFMLSLLHGRGPLLEGQILRTGQVTVESLLTSQLLHSSGYYLSFVLVFGVVLGALLETVWGTPRFLAFYFLVSWGAAVATVLLGWGLGVRGASCGGGAFVLGALVVVAMLYPDHKLVWSLPPSKYLAWFAVFLAGAGLTLLDWTASDRQSFLVAQVAGVPLALAFVTLDPWTRSLAQRWRAHRERKERERVQAIRREVEKLLDKISTHGLQSLTLQEHAFLVQASKHYRKSGGPLRP